MADRAVRKGQKTVQVIPVQFGSLWQAVKDFLALWKDADPDIPILKEAKAEYAKLQ